MAALSGRVDAGPLPVAERQLERKGSAQLDWQSNAVRMRFDDPGWDSGLRVLPPEGQKFWDLSSGKILAVDVENLSKDKQLRLTLHISSGRRSDKDLSDVNSGIALNPGEKRTVTLLLPHPALYFAPKGVPGPKTVETDKVNAIELYMQWPYEGKTADLVDCRVSGFRLEGAPGPAPAVSEKNYFPFIDIYGQYIHADWPEKIRSDDDLKKARAAEDKELAASKRPDEWNRFGGWKNGPQLKATGSFRTEKYQGKWYFVDPEGRLFFSHGLDVLRPHSDATRSTDHEKWFDFPVTTTQLPFNDWNLRKKYGRDDYDSEFYATLNRRLEHWGFNSIGNWATSAFMATGQTPYAMQLSDHDARLPKIAGSKLKFYDVFDPAYVKAMKDLLANASRRDPLVAKSVTDPMCIGYFIDNELNYGNRNGQILGDDILKSPAKQAAKREFVADLTAKYKSIEKLNASWKTEYKSWDALLESTELPKTRDYMADSHVFFDKAVDQYFRLCRDAIKTAAPHRLYLGCRFVSTDATRKPLFEASAKYCDVLTANIYSHSPANFDTPGFPDMPVLIGEFHLGVLDRGMFSAGLVPVGVTQKDRALAYTRFLQGALVNPRIVGAHWFQFRDQPLTGRWDGEGYAIGFVDVADTPYAEMIRASREVGEHMYSYRLRGKAVDFPR